MIKIICKMSNQEVFVKGLPRRLRNKYGITINEYLERFPEQILEYKDKIKKATKSPNTLQFWLQKTDNQEDKALLLLEEHRARQPFRNKKDIRPNQKDYWIKKGYSDEEAKIKISETQSRMKSLSQYISEFGIHQGKIKYQEKIENFENRTEIEIQNLIKLGFSKEEAIAIRKKKRKNSSPRTKEYWLSKGYNDIDSLEMVSLWQKEMSPRTLFYWIKNGYSISEAHEKRKSFQDNTSLEKIMKRYSCNEEIALELKELIKDREIQTKNKIRHNFDDTHIDLLKYYKLVEIETKKTKRKFNMKLIDGMVYDHMYSKKQGFLDGIPPAIIGSISNLTLLKTKDNSRKQDKCSISLEELLNRYKEEKND